MGKLKVRIATRPFQGQVGTLSRGGKHIRLDNSNILLVARFFKFYPATL